MKEEKQQEEMSKEGFMDKAKNAIVNFFTRSRFLRGVRDIPTTLKGFPKNLATKPKNIEHLDLCKRETESYIWLTALIVIAVFIIFLISANLPSMGKQLDGIVSFICGLFMLLGIISFLALVLFIDRRVSTLPTAGIQIMKLTCPQCKKMVAYDGNVHYAVLSREWHVDAFRNPTKSGEERETGPVNITVTGYENNKVQISCKCQNCGCEHGFTEQITTGWCSKERSGVSQVVAAEVEQQLESQVQQVCYDVFELNKRETKNPYGVKVKLRTVEEGVKAYFKV